MSDAAARSPVFTIPSHRSFADALAAGLIARFGKDPLGLARGPHPAAQQPRRARGDRRVRAGERQRPAAAAADPGRRSRARRADRRRARPDRRAEPVPPAIDPDRAAAEAGLDRRAAEGSRGEPAARGRPRADARCAADRGDRAARLRDAVAETDELARHWEKSLDEAAADLRALAADPRASGARSTSPSGATGCFSALAERWKRRAAAGLHGRGGHHHRGAGRGRAGRARRADAGGHGRAARACGCANVFPDEEWDALGPDENGRGEADASAIPSEAAARPDRRRARRGAALALVGRRGLVAGARRGRSPMRWRRRTSRTNGRRCGRPSGG